MTLDLQVVNGIGKKTSERMKAKGIDSLEKLASSNVEDLLKVNGIGKSNAKRYISIAKQYLENIDAKKSNVAVIKDNKKAKTITLDNILSKSSSFDVEKRNVSPSTKNRSYNRNQQNSNFSNKSHSAEKTYTRTKIKKRKQRPVLKTFFSLETMQLIRFLHFKIKHLEDSMRKNEDFSFYELNHVVDYIEILNINYKTQSQIKIFKELEITSNFYDPVKNENIDIWDLMYECARVLWVAAKACSYLSRKFEAENSMKNAIVAMVEASKMYKTAAYFSASCIRQENFGTVLIPENLELNSEESRIQAQNLAASREESKNNLSLASKLNAGLSALTRRLYFLKNFDEAKQNQIKAQYNYDMGKACHLKAKFLLETTDEYKNKEEITNLKKKANYYFYKAEETWERMLENFKELTKNEKTNIKNNLSIVNENIIENDVEIIKDDQAMRIQDPEPLVIVPENLAPFLPRTTSNLTQYKPKEFNFNAYKRYKDLISEISIDYNKWEELQNKKAGIGRTLKQLMVLYDNNDIDISAFTHLYEKYSNKMETIEMVIEQLKNPKKKSQIERKNKVKTKSHT